jgi:SAM-dependent methyltransferase
MGSPVPAKRSAPKSQRQNTQARREPRAVAGGKAHASSLKKNPGMPGRKKKGSAADPLAHVRALAERGAYGAAIQAAEAIIETNPTYWPAWRAIFSILWHVDRFEDSLRILELALASIPPADTARAELTICVAQAAEKTGLRIPQALELTEKTIAALGPTVPLVWHIPRLVSRLGRAGDVLAAAERARALCPDAWESHFNMSVYLIAAGREEEAVASFVRILRPHGKADAHPPADVVEQYASIAPFYEENPLQLYFTMRMADIILAILKTTEDKKVLDAGCGTGLLGTRIKTARLVGIDLSPDMLAVARGRGIYDELVEDDLAAAMAARADTFDIVASSCVLYHVADLAFFFRESARLLVPGGHLFFSVDPAPDSMDIGITPLGEYAHSRAYLRRLAEETGFVEVAIKIMEHRATPGFWCAFRRAS